MLEPQPSTSRAARERERNIAAAAAAAAEEEERALTTLKRDEVCNEIEDNNWEEALEIIDEDNTWFSNFDNFAEPLKDKKTILQLACEKIDDEQTAVIVVRRILEIAYSYPCVNQVEQMEKFINHGKSKKATAFGIALKKDFAHVIEELLTVNVNLLSKESPPEGYHRQVQNAMMREFDKGIKKYTGLQDKKDKNFWKIEFNFKYLIGIKSKYDRYDSSFGETRLLARILQLPNSANSEILLHPLVQIFIKLKQEKLMDWIVFSVIFHVIWSILCAHLMIQHFNNLGPGQNITQYNCTSEMETDQASDDEDFRKGQISCLGYLYNLVYPMYIVALVKELLELRWCPGRVFYFKQKENIGQIVVLIVVPIAEFDRFIRFIPETALSIIYIIGISAALFLLQGQSTKHKNLGIYNHMYNTILTKYVKVFFVFSPILFAYLFMFSVLLPEPEYLMNVEWGMGLTKVVSMMAGEIQYNDVFAPEKCLPYPILTKLLFFIFIITVVIILSNLLVGLTVAEVKGVQAECKVHHLAAMLEVIYLLEHFLTSRLMIFLVHDCLCKKTFPAEYIVGPAKDKPDGGVESFRQSYSEAEEVELLVVKFSELTDNVQKAILERPGVTQCADTKVRKYNDRKEMTNVAENAKVEIDDLIDRPQTPEELQVNETSV